MTLNVSVGKKSNDVVGNGSPSSKIKLLWRSEGKGFSLKQFARKLLQSKSQIAVDWFNAKNGEGYLERSEANRTLAKLCATATRQEKRKPKGKSKPSVS